MTAKLKAKCPDAPDMERILFGKSVKEPERVLISSYNRPIYSPATLIFNWYDDRLPYPPVEPTEMMSVYQDSYRDFCEFQAPDRRGILERTAFNRGLKRELLLEHHGKAYYNNYSTSTDLSYNHLTKGICGPYPRRYRKNKGFMPEAPNLIENYGNTYYSGIQDQYYRLQKARTVIKPPEEDFTEFQDNYVCYGPDYYLENFQKKKKTERFVQTEDRFNREKMMKLAESLKRSYGCYRQNQIERSNQKKI